MDFKTGERIKIVRTDRYTKELLGKTGFIVCKNYFNFTHYQSVSVVVKLDKKVYGSYKHTVSLNQIERDDLN